MKTGHLAPQAAGTIAGSTSSSSPSLPPSTPAPGGFAGRQVTQPGPDALVPPPRHPRDGDGKHAADDPAPPPRNIGLITHGAALLAALDRPWTGLPGRLLPDLGEAGDAADDDDAAPPDEDAFRTGRGAGVPAEDDPAPASPVRLHPAPRPVAPLGQGGVLVASLMTWHIAPEQAQAQPGASDLHLVQAAVQTTNQSLSPTSADPSPPQPASPRGDADDE